MGGNDDHEYDEGDHNEADLPKDGPDLYVPAAPHEITAASKCNVCFRIVHVHTFCAVGHTCSIFGEIRMLCQVCPGTHF